jgi:hypothetical protein
LVSDEFPEWEASIWIMRSFENYLIDCIYGRSLGGELFKAHCVHPTINGAGEIYYLSVGGQEIKVVTKFADCIEWLEENEVTHPKIELFLRADNPPGKVVVRDESGKIIGRQG